MIPVRPTRIRKIMGIPVRVKCEHGDEYEKPVCGNVKICGICGGTGFKTIDLSLEKFKEILNESRRRTSVSDRL